MQMKTINKTPVIHMEKKIIDDCKSLIRTKSKNILKLAQEKKDAEASLITVITGYIKYSGMSTREFSKETGIFPSYLWEILNKRRPFSLETIQKISNWVNKK